MQASEAGRKLIRDIEGLRLEAYPDGFDATGAQKYSIGYGHSGAKKGDRISAEQAEKLFAHDIESRERGVSDAVALHVTTPGQFDALVSLAYNVGVPALQTSTLLRMHNLGDFVGAAAQFARWIHSGGVVDARLQARRRIESDLYRQSSPQLVPATGDPMQVASAGGIGMLFFCPYCSNPCVGRYSVERADRCHSVADHLGKVVSCEKPAGHSGDQHENDRIVWTTAQALPGVRV